MELGNDPPIAAAADWSTCPRTTFSSPPTAPNYVTWLCGTPINIETLIYNVVTALSVQMMLVCSPGRLKIC